MRRALSSILHSRVVLVLGELDKRDDTIAIRNTSQMRGLSETRRMRVVSRAIPFVSALSLSRYTR